MKNQVLGSCIGLASKPRLKQILGSRVRLVQHGDLACDMIPFKLAFQWLAALFHLVFFPLKEFVAEIVSFFHCLELKATRYCLHKAKMGLDDHVETSCADKAASSILVRWFTS